MEVNREKAAVKFQVEQWIIPVSYKQALLENKGHYMKAETVSCPFTRYRLNLCKQKQMFGKAKLSTSICVSPRQTQTINSDPVAWKTQLSEERKLAGWWERILQADASPDVPLILFIWLLCVVKPLVRVLGLGIRRGKHLGIQMLQLCPETFLLFWLHYCF